MAKKPKDSGEAAKGQAPMLRVHLWLEREGGMFFGLGRVQLLELVDRLGSLNRAAKAVGMSYRAAWGRIKASEERLGAQLLAESSGRRGYELTPLARTLMAEFNAWHRDVENYALQRAQALFPWPVRPFEEPEESAPAPPEEAKQTPSDAT